MLWAMIISVVTWEVFCLTMGPLFVVICYGQLQRAWVVISSAVLFSIICCWAWEVLNHAFYWHQLLIDLWSGDWRGVGEWAKVLPLVLIWPTAASAITYYGLDAYHKRVPERVVRLRHSQGFSAYVASYLAARQPRRGISLKRLWVITLLVACIAALVRLGSR